jgi:tRNA (cytidine/uridine-2'-O-)-methyltransferase
LNKINIVLLSPEIPQNTGNISRTCACTGSALHIIRPCGFEITDRNLKRAGLDYWDKLEVYYYDSFNEFLERNSDGAMYYFSAHGKNSHTSLSYQGKVYLIFGKESVGLPQKMIEENYDVSVRIPMRPLLRCLNLSNSVAIATYEVLRQWGFFGME